MNDESTVDLNRLSTQKPEDSSESNEHLDSFVRLVFPSLEPPLFNVANMKDNEGNNVVSGFSHIYVGEMPLNGSGNKKVVLKVMRHSSADVGDSWRQHKVRLFLREGEINEKLADHPLNAERKHIRGVYARGTMEGTYCVSGSSVERFAALHYIVTEFISGVEGEDALAPNSSYTLKQKIDVLSQIARALEIVHAAGYVHRDVKPGNIIVADDRIVKLIDFGLAIENGRKESDDYICGTVTFMAPEQMENRRADPRADIFSLGMVVYWAVEGRHAFSGNVDNETGCSISYKIIRDVKRGKVIPMENAEAKACGLDKVIERCLQRNPAKRYAKMGYVYDALMVCSQHPSLS